MTRAARWINNIRLSRFRFQVQILSFALLIFGGYLALNIGDQLPTFSCVYDQARGGSCYLMGFQHQMTLPFNRLFSPRGLGVLTGLLTFVLFFVVLNKAWCGYICPLGTIQDWLTILRRRLGIACGSYPAPVFKQLSRIKYVLLALLILIPMAIGNSLFGLPRLNHDFGVPFCMICPGRTLLPLFNGDISQLAVDFSSGTRTTLSGLGLAITGLFISGGLVKKRFFCLFCPMSALHYLFSRLGLLRLEKIAEKCTRCGNCYRACDVGIRDIADDLEHTNIVKDDCMMCFKCVEACPEDECLKVKFLGLPVFVSTLEGFYRRQEIKNER